MELIMKLKLKNGDEIDLDEATAKKLYDKLDRIYGERNLPYIPYIPPHFDPLPRDPWSDYTLVIT